MKYKLTFLECAKKEWKKLGTTIQIQFQKKIGERLEHPNVTKDKLAGLKDCYKIKLRKIGYILVYQVIEERIVIQVIAIGKRDKDFVYKSAHQRLKK